MYQKLILIGNVGKKPELRMTAAGKPFTTFSLATNKAYKQDGVTNEQVCWWRVTVWGDQAENVVKYVDKGSLIGVEGEITPDTTGNPRLYQVKDGTWASGYDMRAQTVKFLDRKAEKETDDEYQF